MTRNPVCRSSRSPRGAAVLVVVVSIFAAMVIGASLVQLVLMQKRQARLDRHRTQAVWLAEAGLDRVRQQAATLPDYAGETWQPEVPMQDRLLAGRVVITRTAPGEWAVVADYPAESPERVRIRRTWTVPATAITSTEGIVP